jgi:hypothetical protein
MSWSEDEEEGLSLREIVAALKEKLDGIEEKFRAVEKAKTEWRPIGTGVSGETPVEYFLSATGEWAELPRSFVVGLKSGKRLDGSLTQDHRDPDKVILRRGGEVEARIPKALLAHLMKGWKGESRLSGNLNTNPDAPSSETETST